MTQRMTGQARDVMQHIFEPVLFSEGACSSHSWLERSSGMLTQYVEGYQHIGIPTDDIENTSAFYEGLGFTRKWATEYGGHPVRFFEWGSILIETYEKDGGAADTIGAIDHIALNCTDIVSLIAQARTEGYVFREGPAYLPYWEHGVEYVTILGPNHEIVEFIQKFTSEEEKEKAVKEIG